MQWTEVRCHLQALLETHKIKNLAHYMSFLQWYPVLFIWTASSHFEWLSMRTRKLWFPFKIDVDIYAALF